jgi:murein DD-endopeptidase MepM/ murein hydrolase activator NlpD
MRRLLLTLGFLVLLSAPAHAEPRAGFGWPLAGMPPVARGFQAPSTTYGPGHRGVDLTATLGQQVLAAGPGRVTYAGLLAGRGVVTVTHPGGLRTTYEPVSPSVRVGTTVGLGQPLGTLTGGHASCRTGAQCLHWGLLRGRVYLDPLSLLQPTAVRLLPLGPAPRAPAVAGLSGPPAPAAAPRLHAATSPGDRGWARAGGALTALGALAAGIGLLARPVRRLALVPPPAPGGGSTVDALAERRHRRAA